MRWHWPILRLWTTLRGTCPDCRGNGWDPAYGEGSLCVVCDGTGHHRDWKYVLSGELS